LIAVAPGGSSRSARVSERQAIFLSGAIRRFFGGEA